MILTVLCILSVNVLPVSAEEVISPHEKGIEISSKLEPIREDVIKSRALAVTSSYVWYGSQLYAENFLLTLMVLEAEKNVAEVLALEEYSFYKPH